MKVLKNKKGMTLVEIIVALLIASILLVIMGSLILNSFSYFNKTTDQSLNKQSLDSVASFTREQLLYTSDVRVDTKEPDEESWKNWKALYVKGGRLFHDDDMIEDNDEQLYSDQFYNHNKIVIKVTGIGKYRLDIKYVYASDGEENYTTTDTLELLNVKVKAENDTNFDPLSNIRKEVNLEEGGYKIYYQQIFEYKDPPKPDDPTQGTVADQMKCLTLHNNRFEFRKTATYRKGDMVFHKREQDTQGYWWMMVSDSYWDMPPGQHSIHWKKIDANFDRGSVYEVGDVIIYKDNYYRCKKDSNWGDYTPEPGAYDDINTWEKLTEKPEATNLCTINRVEKNKDCIIYKLIDAMKRGEFTLEDIPLYDNDAHYTPLDDDVEYSKKEDFVKMYDDKLKIYRYFIKMSNPVNPGHIPGTSDGKRVLWQEIKVDWDKNSYYAEGDVVLWAFGSADYIKVKEGNVVDEPNLIPPERWDTKKSPWDYTGRGPE